MANRPDESAPAPVDIALAYAARGWPVLPCKPQDKKPLVPRDVVDGKPVPKSGGLSKATCDGATIRAWWKRWPNALVGVATGKSGFFALDFDPRIDADTGEEWTLDRLKRELEEQMGCALPTSLAVRTPSGGVHVYFRQPADLPIRNSNALPEHVDVRGDGGYVIAPPGKNAAGGIYRWLRDDDDAPIVDAPEALLALLRPRNPSKPNGSTSPPRGGGGTAIERYALTALQRECEEVERAGTGGRQDALNRAAYNIAQLVAADALPEGMARAALEISAGKNAGRDSEAQLMATIDSGWAAGLAKPRDLAAVAERSTARANGGRVRRSEANDNSPDEEAAIEAQHRRLCMLPLTDLGNAERFAARFGDRVRYVDKWGWIAHDSKRFIHDGAEALIGGMVHSTVRAMRHEARVMRDSGRRDRGEPGALDDLIETKRDGTEVLLSDKLAAWAKASESATKLACIAGIARHLSAYGMTVQPEQLDRNPYLINCANGTLELIHEPDAPEPWVELRLRPHDPNDLITRLVPVDYRPGATCERYDRFLARVQPSEDMRAFLHRWGGLSLTGDVSEQKLAFFYGKGANGKSTLVDTWATIAGDYAGTVPIETFLDQGRKRKGSEASPDLAALVGVRLLRTSEPEKGSKLAEALIKLATGGEPMPVRRLNRDPFDLHPAFKMIISGNHRPSISGVDDGIWRRVMLVPWDVQIPDAEKDRQLVAKLRNEASGILNRLLQGLIDWRLRGLQEPASVRGATADYREQSDPLGRFLAACTRPAEGQRVQSSKLYALFVAWVRSAGEREWTQMGFSKAMLDRGYRKIESHGMRWLDVEMTRTPEDMADDNARDDRLADDFVPPFDEPRRPWEEDDDDLPA